MPLTLILAVPFLCFLGVATRFAVAGPNEADVDRFLIHMDLSMPVTGVFVLRGSTERSYAASTDNFADEYAKAHGLKVRHQPLDTELICRWSADRLNELMEPTGDGNIWRSFFRMGDSLLDGNSPNNYNLVDAGKLSYVRPGSFYQFFASNTWRSLRSQGQVFRTDERLAELAAKCDSPCTAFGIRAHEETFLAVTASADGRLLAAESYTGSGLSRRLTIEQFAVGEQGQVFPSKASLEIFGGSDERLLRTVKLEAQHVNWPISAVETAAALEMILPAGTLVFDQMLGKKALLPSDTSANNVIKRQDLFVPMDTMELSPSTAPTSPAQVVLLAITTAALVVLAVAVIYARRRRPSAS
jgi:hypothetical protein